MAARTPASPFTAAYRQGMPRSLLDGRRPRQVSARPRRAVPVESIALGGMVITPEGAKRGWVTVEGGQVTAVTTRKPSGPRALVTDGVILPGLIDLHGHPEFNVFAAWEPPKQYVNRYAWRASDEYHELVRDPQNTLLTKVPSGTQLRYAEIRAVVGGTTAIQGASLRTQGKVESLVRNVDGVIFGQHRARSMIDLPTSLTARGGDDLVKTLQQIRSGEVDALYVHLAEGRSDNARSVGELALLSDTLGALTPATVIIHGTALSRDQLGQVKDAGAKLVWSPQSNLRLYSQTTRAADAVALGLPMALGADWLPSGSTCLLAELKVARTALAQQGCTIAARDLVTMVTSGAADIAGLGDHLGRLAPGRPADLVVLARRDADAYESVCAATPADVQLVLIGGDLVYGRQDWVSALAADPTDARLEPVIAWGRPMLLDTSFDGDGSRSTQRLADLRTALTTAYPPVGPIWA